MCVYCTLHRRHLKKNPINFQLGEKSDSYQITYEKKKSHQYPHSKLSKLTATAITNKEILRVQESVAMRKSCSHN